MGVFKNSKNSPVERAFRDNIGSLTQFIRQFFDSPADVEDLLQETFIKVFEAEHTTTISSPKAFLYKTAKNLSLNELSKRRTRKTDAIADIDLLTVLIRERNGHDSLPEFETAIEEQLALAWELVDQMSPRVREVFILRKVHGLKQREIADQLGIAESTVEKHIAKGLEQITASDQN